MFHDTYKFLAICAALLLGLLSSRTSMEAQTLQIDPSTANWIEGFADFVRWQGEDKAEQITIGIIGSPEVANYLIRRANARTTKPRFRVVNLDASDSFSGLDIVFVGSSNKTRWKEIFSKCKGNGTLTIGSNDGFVDAGGCVEFVVRRNRLRFYINQENARDCNIVISSKLLELAIEPKR